MHKADQRQASFQASLERSMQNEQASRIYSKIEQMRQSVAQLSVLSNPKTLENITELQKEREDNRCLVQQEQRRLMHQINALQQSLLALQRDRMIKFANLNNSQQLIEQTLRNADEEARHDRRRLNEKFDEYRDLIMNLKVQLADLQITSKERAGKWQRQCELHLLSCHKSVQKLTNNDQFELQPQFGQLKSLKKSVQQELKLQNRASARTNTLISQLGHLLNARIGEEQRRQREGFQQNYKALEQLFLFLSEQYGVQ